jgi:hypothetical protein
VEVEVKLLSSSYHQVSMANANPYQENGTRSIMPSSVLGTKMEGPLLAVMMIYQPYHTSLALILPEWFGPGPRPGP